MTDLAISPSDTSGQLSRIELVALARKWASHVKNTAPTGQPADRRWYCRLDWNENYEVWLLGWNQDQSTDFHNHGGSSGAVVVAAGSLVEERISSAMTTPSSRVVGEGQTLSIDVDTIHNVYNAGLGPSLSVHVYSPPLSAMTYFSLEDGAVVEGETIDVEGPGADGEEIEL